MGLGMLPYLVLVPNQLQVAHIGLGGGLHENAITEQKMAKMKVLKYLKPFHDKLVTDDVVEFQHGRRPHPKGFGGWGHPADHYHCMELFGEKESKAWSDVIHLEP